ncbi:MAG: dipicolinate synthase subunit B [Clostridia bacterium]|nr:dipicolinate synthase subunit B [Clostridia bacterium]
MNIAFGITGSFCTHAEILKQIETLVKKGHNIIPIVTPIVLKTDTRFGKAKEFIESLESITSNKVVSCITQAEPLGPKNIVDIMIIAPCTGNTLSKLANAITDNAVLLTAKSLLRNNKPIVIGVSTNDALGQNAKNLATLLNSKNIYFVPMRQDDFGNKPKSIVAKWNMIEKTLNFALNYQQIQPVFVNAD